MTGSQEFSTKSANLLFHLYIFVVQEILYPFCTFNFLCPMCFYQELLYMSTGEKVTGAKEKRKIVLTRKCTNSLITNLNNQK